MPACTLINGHTLAAEQANLCVPWWSVTKTVLAAAALSLVRDGLTRLDDELVEGPFSLRQLLRHQAGLADYSELPEYHAAVRQGAPSWPVEDMLQRLQADRLRYPPGEGWRYSNVGYLQVGRLIERITGLTLEQALSERVFSPLGVSGVRLARTPADLQAISLGTVPGYDPGWVYHGLLTGPLAAMTEWLDRLLAGALLPAPLLQAMQQAVLLGGALPGRPWITPGYGLGLMMGGADNGLALAGHTGVGPGGCVAVYHCADAGQRATCAVFSASLDEGRVEAQVAQRLKQAIEGV